MKALIASIAALGLMAGPALATTKPAAAKPAATAKPKTSVAKAARSEGESVKTEAAEHRAAARHHGSAKCSCPAKVAHRSMKSAKTPSKPAAKPTPKKG
jgi:hypothetical protein